MNLLRFFASSAAVVLGMMVSGSAQGASVQASVTLAWDPNPGGSVAGYHLYIGGVSQNYTNMVDTKGATSVAVSNLAAGKTYYFAVTAYDITGLESSFSSQVAYTVPVNTANLAKITLKMNASKQPTLSGTAPAGYVYNVLASKDLKTWSTLGSVVASTSGTISYTDPVTTNKVRYYRLVQTATTSLAEIALKMSASKQPTISGTAPAGYVYNVLASKDLKTWTTLGSVVASTSGAISYTDSVTTNKARYYRLQQTSP